MGLSNSSSPRGIGAESVELSILVLGVEESGKKTIMKQLAYQIGNETWLNETNEQSYRAAIHRNIVKNMKELVVAAVDDINSVENQNFASELLHWDNDKVLGPSEYAVLKSLLSDSGVKNLFDNRYSWENSVGLKLKLQDTFEYFLRELDRLCTLEENLRDSDTIRCYIPTELPIETTISPHKGISYRVVSLGGTRQQDFSYLNLYTNDVKCIVFVAALSDYDQYCSYDVTRNRQEESVELFREYCSPHGPFGTAVEEIAIILFLNKSDIFREKITKVPFKVPNGEKKRNVDYDGPELYTTKQINIATNHQYESAYESYLDYIRYLYLDRQKNTFTHVLCALDTQSVRYYYQKVFTIVLRQEIQSSLKF